jgi:hypothetical protein
MSNLNQNNATSSASPWSNFASMGAKKASATYANFLAQQRGTRDKFRVQEQYERDVPRAVSSFSQRGLAGPGVRSGVYSRGLGDLARKNFDSLSDIDFDMNAANNQFKLDTAETDAEYNAFLADIETQKQNQIGNTAATLTAFRPFLGV